MDAIRQELLHAWVRCHRGVHDERVADAMRAAFDAGLTEADIGTVMDDAAHMTEYVRARRYRTGCPSFSVRSGA